MQFELFAPNGVAKGNLSVSLEEVDTSVTTAVKAAAHLVFVCDASGSMYSVMGQLRSMVQKFCTIAEYKGSAMFISICSFASAGDLRIHADRVLPDAFMADGSKELAQLQSLQARGCTGLSQGLKWAEKAAKPGEQTAVLLLSDGYANDRSAGEERRIIDIVMDGFRKRSDVVLNTIALGSYADWALLAYMANMGSGVCFQAPTVKEVWDTLMTTGTQLTGQQVPAVEIPLKGASYLVAVASGKVIGGSTDMTLKGLTPGDKVRVYRYVPGLGKSGAATDEAILAYARCQLAEGNINACKRALLGTRLQDINVKHARALTSEDLAALANDLDALLASGTAGLARLAEAKLPGADEASVLQVLELLNEYRANVQVDAAAISNGYKRRGVKRIPGTRLPDGTVQIPDYSSEYKDASPFVEFSGATFSANNANASVRVERPINIKDAQGNVVAERAGVKLDKLRSYAQYTIVGDGVLCVSQLNVRINNKRLFAQLQTLGCIPAGETLDTEKTYCISFSGRPMIDYSTVFEANAYNGLMKDVLTLSALASLFSSVKKGKSSDYTAEQVASLKECYITEGGNFSPPTTTVYADREEALRTGVLDTRVTTEVILGTQEILSASTLGSANKFLDRRFTASRGGTAVDIKAPLFLEDDVTFGIKALTARTKLTTVDTLLYPLYLDFLGLGSPGAIGQELTRLLQYNAPQVEGFYRVLRSKNPDQIIELLDEVVGAISSAKEKRMADVRRLVFYIGATGTVPDELGCKPMNLEQVKVACPQLQGLSKDETDAVFYQVGDNLLTIYRSTTEFTTD
jgi:hypothetical protein